MLITLLLIFALLALAGFMLVNAWSGVPGRHPSHGWGHAAGTIHHWRWQTCPRSTLS